MSTPVLIFSRMDSERLPGKALLPVAGRPLLARVIDRVRLSAAGPIVVCTSERKCDEPIAQLAEDLGISEQSLYRWAKQADIDKKDVPSGQLMTKEREELAKVRKELKQVTMERDFLKKTAAYFARENK